MLAAELGMLSRLSRSGWPGGKTVCRLLECGEWRGSVCATNSPGSEGAKAMLDVEDSFSWHILAFSKQD